jgi:hypothetical protein
VERAAFCSAERCPGALTVVRSGALSSPYSSAAAPPKIRDRVIGSTRRRMRLGSSLWAARRSAAS